MGHIVEQVLAGAGVSLLAVAIAWCVGFIVAYMFDDGDYRYPSVCIAHGFAIIVSIAGVCVFCFAIGGLVL